MKRNKLSHRTVHNIKQSIAFHEAGHAVTICLNNRARQQPPVFFQIVLKDTRHSGEFNRSSIDSEHSMARVEGGRLVQSLIDNVDDVAHKLISLDENIAPLIREYQVAFDTDVVNLLIGPLAEAKQSYIRDNEQFNYQLIDLKALKNYGGDADLALAWEYLGCYSKDKLRQEEKLNELFIDAGNFISDSENWQAITTLANTILHSHQEIISCEDVLALVANNLKRGS